MHSPATDMGRKTPSLKKLFAVMGGCLGLSVVLAELASATTNSQPAIGQTFEPSPAVAQQPEAAPVEQQPSTVAAEAEPQPNYLTYGVHEVMNMYKGGVKADVLLTYIETSNYPYQLSSKEILYLNKIGVPSEIVSAMMKRDHQGQLAKADSVQQQADVAAPVAPPMPVTYLQPPVVVVQQAAPRCAPSTCSTPASAASGPTVTVIGSRYGSTFYNGCYYGPFSCSPARAYFNAEFGPLYKPYFNDFAYGFVPRFYNDGFRGGFGHGHRWGRF